METQPTDIYQFSSYYDGLFDRDYTVECDFLEGCLQRHGPAGERSFIELGCGPARDGRELCKRGYRVVGLDRQPSMLAYARREMQREGVELELVEGDLIDFEIARPVAMAACMWDTIYNITRNEDMVRHLRAVARSLLPGGIYVVETSHPRYALRRYYGHVYRNRSGDVDVEVTWGLPDDPYDSITQEHLVTVQMVARRNGEEIERYVEHLPQRAYLFQEFRALVELSGAFAEVHFYGRSCLPFVPLSDDPVCDGMLAVMVKR